MEAHHVLDVSLRGRPDDEIFDHELSEKLALLTADVGFGNLLRYPLGSHAGVIVARFPNEVPTSTLAAAIVEALGRPNRTRLLERHWSQQQFRWSSLVATPNSTFRS